MMESTSKYRFISVVPKPNGIDFGYIIENCDTIEQANAHFDRVQERFESNGRSSRFYIMGKGSNVTRQSEGQDKYRLDEHIRRGGTIVGDWHGQLGCEHQRSAGI